MLFTESGLTDTLLLLILALILGHGLSMLYRRKWLALEPLNAFWAGIVIIYPAQAITYGAELSAWHADGILDETLLWIFFGLIWVVIGYELRLGKNLGKRIPAITLRLSPTKLTLVGCLFVVLGLMGWIYVIDSAQSLEAWLAVPRGGTDYENVVSYGAVMQNFLPAGITLLLFQTYLFPSSVVKKIFIWVLAGLMFYWFLYLGSRSRVITFSISLLAIYYLTKRKNPSLFLLIPLFVLLSMITTFQGNYRGYFTDLSFNLDKIDLDEAYGVSAPAFMGGDKQAKNISRGSELNCVMSVIELVPESVNYNYGYGHLEVFTRVIPRALWPEKVYPNMEAVQEIFKKGDLTNSYVRDLDLLMGPALTYIGHWYLVGGPIALIFSGLATGLFFRMVRSFYEFNPKSHGVVIIYALLIQIGFVEAAATPLNWVYSIPIVLIPTWFVLRLCQIR